MPVSAPSLRSCGCVVQAGHRCDHMRAADAARKARHDQHRPSASVRGYDKKWEFTRRGFLRSHPFCRMCRDRGLEVPATVVDHIAPHRGDKKLFWRPSNWQPLCASCHSSRKQSEERR